MSEAVLISIHPKYANAILDGSKRYEFRRTRFRKPIKQLVIYCTHPTSAIVGTADVSGVTEDTPKAIWKKFAKFGAIGRKEFFEYFADCDTAVAIELSDVDRFEVAVPLEELFPGVKPPQSFRYVSNRGTEPTLEALWA